ncbi:hypothetical protein [Arthrobacter sp. NPDC090010]|uniref:hypothetical protein n=1 Tax=Arthrobacter sp. NPDC090010 TaxID=3363942 RepID=UPI003805BDA3
MSDPVTPAEATRALGEIDDRSEQVIRRRVFPAWWWWSYAALFTALAASMEIASGSFFAVGIGLFVIASFVIDVPVRRAAGTAAPRRGIGGPGTTRRTLIGLAAFVVSLVIIGLATGLLLKALAVPYPGTIAAAVVGIAFAIAGPMLVRRDASALVRHSRIAP